MREDPYIASKISALLLALAAFVATGSAGALQPPPAHAAAPTSTAPFSPLKDGQGGSALNWAGYVAEGDAFTAVAGSWQVPDVADPLGESADATWVGIGGTRSQDLLQAGTEALPTYGGAIAYRAWYEALPGESRNIPIDIAPGDRVRVKIAQRSADAWTISFENLTTARSYETSVTYASSYSSAEWIEEMPVAVRGSVGLDEFGSVQFSQAWAFAADGRESIAEAGGYPLVMTNGGGVPIATPTELGSDGASFKIVRERAAATPLRLDMVRGTGE